jgi:DNA-binding transcriptional LysR family regulator
MPDASDHEVRALTSEQLLQLRREFTRLSFDQLRTLVFVHRYGSARKAALELEREQGSVQGQLKTLNSHFEKLCGRPLVQKGRQRGDDVIFTQTGQNVVQWAEVLLSQWNSQIDHERATVGDKLRVATTAFTLPILARLWQPFLLRVRQRVQPVFDQVRTSEFLDCLDKREFDLALAGVPSLNGKPGVPNGVAFEPWSRDSLCVLTNLPADELPGTDVSWSSLANHHLILPAAGVIRDAADILARAEHGKVQPSATISDVYYGINLLRYGLVRACMLATGSVGQWAQATPPTHPDEPKPCELRTLNLTLSAGTVEVVPGLFGRAGDRKRLGADHPIQVFWDTFMKARPQTDRASSQHHA